MSKMGDYVIGLIEDGLYDPEEHSYVPYDEEMEYNELDEDEDYEDE